MMLRFEQQNIQCKYIAYEHEVATSTVPAQLESSLKCVEPR